MELWVGMTVAMIIGIALGFMTGYPVGHIFGMLKYRQMVKEKLGINL